MINLYQCEKCERIYKTKKEVRDCEGQPIQPLLETYTKVLYQQKVCQIGPKNIIDTQHVRYYQLFIKAKDTENNKYVGFGLVSELEFTVL
jgi:hypothetical protein